jgi:aminopeptidase YwaD
MRNTFNRSALIALLVLLANLLSLAQARSVDERNVRAQMIFLAGDALQGRGSGTIFERIAAEYVGSQFMQFGLEPAGEPGWDGKPSFVQTVNSTRNTFAEPPSLKIGLTTLTHGKEMLVVRANTGSVRGSLQKGSPGDKPNADSAVLLKLPAGFTGNPTQVMGAAIAAGASIVMLEETPQARAGWANTATRPLVYTVAFTPARPSVMIVLSKEQSDAVSALPAGTQIEFSGRLAPAEVRQTWNAMGKITGTDRSAEVVLLSSHLDHLGVRETQAGPDKIFNGADDDASGTVAVMELARTIAAGKRPKRTVYFVCFGSEESGGLGSRFFVSNLPFPKENLVANLQFEMIGRPDPKVKAEELWLTGYERSNLGSELAKRGAKLVPDPHPTQNFFQRSDNYALAQQGIVAHTVSSFGLHTNYHRPSDELRTIDFAHMTRAIDSMITPVGWLINADFRPTWNPGMSP